MLRFACKAPAVPFGVEYYTIFIDSAILSRHFVFRDESSGCIEAADDE